MPSKAIMDSDHDSYLSLGDDLVAMCKSEKEQRLHAQQRHVRISSSITITSPVILVHVGPRSQTFIVHKDLIMLHSGYFRTFYNSPNVEKTTPVYLHTITPHQFANFLIWLQAGEISSDSSPKILPPDDKVTIEDEYEGLWAAGAYLEAPYFQNYCMDKICDYGEKHKGWPSAEVAAFAYRNTAKGCNLRRLVADILGRENPLKACNSGSKEWKEWQDVLKKYPQLSLDMLSVAGFEELEGDEIWDDDWKASFLEEAMSVDDRWESLILEDRSLAMVERAAKGGCIRSIIELNHLTRAKGDDKGEKMDPDFETGFEVLNH